MTTNAEKISWHTAERTIYPTKKTPSIVTLSSQTFITIDGTGDPNQPAFTPLIESLYAISYTIRMAPKKSIHFPGAYEYVVYPLEGFWTLAADYHDDGHGLDKSQLKFKLMIKQPAFVTPAVFAEALTLAAPKIAPAYRDRLHLETIDEGPVGMILHVGSFDDEPASFARLEEYLTAHGYARTSKAHKEIYLSDFRRVAEAKRKTILRVGIAPQE